MTKTFQIVLTFDDPFLRSIFQVVSSHVIFHLTNTCKYCTPPLVIPNISKAKTKQLGLWELLVWSCWRMSNTSSLVGGAR